MAPRPAARGSLPVAWLPAFGLALFNAFEMPIAHSSGMLDTQRENNRLTGETNRLLKDVNRTIGNLGGTVTATFG
jgi:hypothetical protein